MWTPDENSTLRSFSWEEPLDALAQIEPHMYGTLPGLDLDYLPQNIFIQSFQDPTTPHSSGLDHLHTMPRPDATNWSTFENHNLLPGFDLHMINDNPETNNRIRINSMESNASSLSYNLLENQTNCIPGEAYVGYNDSYQPSPQSNHNPNYDHRTILQPKPIFTGLASSRLFNEYSKTYLANFTSNFRPKVSTFCLNRPYKCEKCGSSFSRNHDLKRHSRIHLEVKPFPCSCCDKAFARKDALKRHLLVKGCSPSKRCPTRGNSQHPRQKSTQTTTIAARKSTVGHNRSPSNSSSVPHYMKTNNNEANEPFREIQLQNIKCAMPTFL